MAPDDSEEPGKVKKKKEKKRKKEKTTTTTTTTNVKIVAPGKPLESRALAVLPIPLSATGNTWGDPGSKVWRSYSRTSREQGAKLTSNSGSKGKGQGNAFVKQ